MRFVLAAAVVLVLAGCAGHSDGPAAQPSRSPSAAPEPSTGASSADPGYVAARVRLGSNPCGIVQAGPRVWVSNYHDGTVQWIDRDGDEPGPAIEVGSMPCGLVAGGGSVWVENYGSDDVTRLDERTGEVLATVEVGSSPYDVEFAAGAAWVTDYGDGTVSRIDARTNRRTVVQVGGQPIGIARVAGGVWVARSDGRVLRIDPRTSRVSDRLSAGDSASWTAYDRDTLWVSNRADGSVTRIDARARRVVARVAVGPDPQDGVVVDGLLYVPLKDGRIVRVDPAGDAVTATFRSTVRNPFVISGGAGELWAADFFGTEAVRIDLAAVPAG